MSIRRLGRAIIEGKATVLLDVDGRVMPLDAVSPALCAASGGFIEPLLADWSNVANTLSTALICAETRDYRIGKLLAPLVDSRKLICIGTNYYDHIAEMRVTEKPRYPYAFLKPLTTVAAPGDDVVLPRMSRMVDWEAELGVIIGRTARRVAVDEALDFVAAYTPINDVSARDWLDERPSVGVDWVMQKGFDGFTPLGPWLTLACCIPDPQLLTIECRLNGHIVQHSSTANMVFSVAQIIAHLSAIMTLLPGDIIATGTPAGVGFARSPRRFIADADTVTVVVGPLGVLQTRFVAERAADER